MKYNTKEAEDFGRGYKEIINNVWKYLSINPNNKNIKENFLEKYLINIKNNLDGKTSKDILSQHKTTSNLNENQYQRIEDYSFPTFITNLPSYEDGRGASGKSIRNVSIPYILVAHKEELNEIGSHEVQHYIHGKLLENNILKTNLNVKEDGEDFIMLRDELMSKLVANQRPVGYTHSQFLGRAPTKISRENALMFYNLFPLFAEASDEKGLNRVGLIYGLFHSKNFQDLFSNSLDYSEGADISLIDFNNVEFVDKNLKDGFSRRMNIKNIPSKPEVTFTWGEIK